MGLLFTFHLLGRTKQIHLYADHDLKEIIDMQLEISKTELQYPIIFHPLDSTRSTVIFEDSKISVTTIPLDHRIPTAGFLFKEKNKDRKIRKEVINKLNIPVEEFENIKKGKDFVDETGRIHKNADLTIAGPDPVSYAYCSDTGYTESYIPIIKGVDLLYHESTFMHDKEKNAREKFHCTSEDAAKIAKKCGAKQLMLGHYSARYDDLNPLLEEAKKIFKNTILSEEGLVYDI
jgi:ribonuclease Z